jgi:5-formyltetrahydrofolate cyclo-ligase
MSAATPDQRAVLRARLRDERMRMPPAERIAAAQGVLRSLEQLPEFLVDRRIAGYWAVNGELSLHLAVASMWRRGQSYHLPVAAANRRLRYAPYAKGTDVAPNRFGIPEPIVATDALVEPSQLELVLVPLLGFDRRGNRLGYGGGFYDASYAFLNAGTRPAEPLLVGIAYASQECDDLVAQPWDVALDFIATENELIDCTVSTPEDGT